MKFLLNEGIKFFKITSKKRIGFVIPQIHTYNNVMASTRMRVYDIINFFKNDPKYFLELYKPIHNYDILIFQKYFDKKAYNIAIKHKKRGVKIILDLNVNYFDWSSTLIEKKQSNDLKSFLNISDHLIVTGDFLYDKAREQLPKLDSTIINECISEKYFLGQKIKFNREKILVWSGYSQKAKDLYIIKDVLEDLRKKHSFKIRVIAEKDPQLSFKNIEVEYKKYAENTIVNDLSAADFFIAPRNLDDPYNLSHSFTKIGVAMGIGLIVFASPVPSYLNSPAVICRKNEDWKEKLDLALNEKIEIDLKSKQGKKYVKNNFSQKIIKKQYENFFNKLDSKKV